MAPHDAAHSNRDAAAYIDGRHYRQHHVAVIPDGKNQSAHHDDDQSPMHGGNAGLIGWQLIGYPGPLMNYREEIDKSHGVPWRRKPVSLAQVVGRPVKGWEEEQG